MTVSEREEWLSHVMEEYRTCLMRMTYLYLGDFALAEDAVQETFIKAYYHLDSFRGESSEKTWLIRIAINTCISINRKPWMRLLKRAVSLDSVDKAGITDRYRDDTVINAVCNLPNKYKQAILLYYYQEMSVPEIADALSIPVSTAQTRLTRGRDKLRTVLKEWYFDEE